MNEELIRQCAREVVPFVDEPGTGEQNYRYAAAVIAIETYHARAVAPLERENEALKLLLNATEGMATDYAQKIMELRAKVAPLVEAATEALRIAMEQSVKARAPECGKFGEIAQDLDAALAPFQQEAK